MHSLNFAKSTIEKPDRQRAKNHTGDHDELIRPNAFSPNNVLDLQRIIGNRGVQRLLTQEKPAPQQVRQPRHGTGTPTLRKSIQPKIQPDIQRCSCGGTCAKCQHEQEEQIATPQLQRELVIQRWWDGEEETEEESWWDQAVETVTDTASSAWDTVTEGVSDVWDSAGDTASHVWDWGAETAGDVWDTVKEGASNIWGEVSSESDIPEPEESSPESSSDMILLPTAAVVRQLLIVRQADRSYFEAKMKPLPATKLPQGDFILPPQFCFDDRVNDALLVMDDERARVDPLIDKAVTSVRVIPLAMLTSLLGGGMIGLLGTKTPMGALVAAGIGAVAGLLAGMADAYENVHIATEAIVFYNILADELYKRWNDYYACRMGKPSDSENPEFTTAPAESEP